MLSFVTSFSGQTLRLEYNFTVDYYLRPKTGTCLSSKGCQMGRFANQGFWASKLTEECFEAES